MADVAQTPAYQDGRIRGFSLFTTFDRTDSSWGSFHTAQPEMNQIASMIAAEWKPGTKPLEPPAKRVRLTSATNIRLSPHYTGAIGAANKLFTLPAGSEFAHLGTASGDSFRGSVQWYVVSLDVDWLNGGEAIEAYLHSELAEVI
jgi:hypothetical protein